MEFTAGKPRLLSNILVRTLSFGILVFLARVAYVVTVTGESRDSGDFCLFSSVPDALRHGFVPTDPYVADSLARVRSYYSSVFQDLIAEGYLSPSSKSLCLETLTGQDVAALREIGVLDSLGISKKSSPPLVVSGRAVHQPFHDNTFDFEFSGDAGLERSVQPAKFAFEVSRTLKPGGFFVVHTASKDIYSLNSLLDLFNSCRLIKSREIDGIDASMPSVREVVLKKHDEVLGLGERRQPINLNGESLDNCSIPGYKRELIRNAEPLITEEPLSPWISVKRNMKNVRYLSSMVDISFKNKYVYIDVGARGYGSSIGSWFEKQYPKQNKTFEIFAIEADKAFRAEYQMKKGVNLLPYAAWVRNETLFFEINREPSRRNDVKGKGMGRVQAVESSSNYVADLDKIMGFDFANWVKGTVSEKDFVIMKMDVEGTEFHLIPRLVETGALCLIDEMFLECHYNRWQRCCRGERNSKYEKTYTQCLDLFSSLRKSGVLVHQWW